jgi:hypothetical protein
MEKHPIFRGYKLFFVFCHLAFFNFLFELS